MQWLRWGERVDRQSVKSTDALCCAAGALSAWCLAQACCLAVANGALLDDHVGRCIRGNRNDRWL